MNVFLAKQIGRFAFTNSIAFLKIASVPYEPGMNQVIGSSLFLQNLASFLVLRKLLMWRREGRERG